MNTMYEKLGLFYLGKLWTLVALCELRDDFRHFRLDRMNHITQLDERYQLKPGRTLQDFLQTGEFCDMVAMQIYHPVSSLWRIVCQPAPVHRLGC